ncbi:MAG: hypothetical protein VZS44_01820 [Bacilli bacterium]|nr:hypothetical protein [Bacilli bacterium]
MEGNIFKRFIYSVKDKLHNNYSYPLEDEYVFSEEEINKLSKENKEKMLALKNNTLKRKEELPKEKEVDELILDNLDNNKPQKRRDVLDTDYDKDKITYTKIVKKLNGELNEEPKEEKVIEKPKVKYLNLTDELQNTINEAIEKVDMIILDSYIIRGKDLLEHNYTITYGEESLRFVYQARHEFEILIEYLIGFNNEKKGIYDKTTFSDKLDDEWHYLKNYIKILEQIKDIKEK